MSRMPYAELIKMQHTTPRKTRCSMCSKTINRGQLYWLQKESNKEQWQWCCNCIPDKEQVNAK